MKRRFKPYMIYGICFVVFLLWFIVGAKVVTGEMDAQTCFWVVSLPFLGMFGTIVLGIRRYFKDKKQARQREQTEKKRNYID
jgi:membrane protein implicated in regulation of membrane protease activity